MIEVAEIYEFVCLYRDKLITLKELINLIGEEKAQKVVSFLNK